MKNSLTRRSLLAGGACLLYVAGFGAASADDQKPLNIAVSVPGLSMAWYVNMQKQFEKAAQDIGGVNLILTDGQNSAPKQTADVEAAIIQKVDAIIVAPIDVNAVSPALEQAIEAGIPVVTVDRQADSVDGILHHVGADNVKGGEAQGESIVAQFPNGAKIFNLQGQPGAGPAIDRNRGVHNVLDKQKDKYPIVFEQTANFSRAEGLSVTEAGITANGAPDVIVAANDEMAFGAAQALAGRGITDVKIYGFDALPEALKAIGDGALYATVEQSPGEQCRRALQTAVDYLRDGKKPEVAVDLITPFVVTKENLSKAERLSEIGQ